MLPPIVFSVSKPKNSGKQRATPAEEMPESTGPTAPPTALVATQPLNVTKHLAAIDAAQETLLSVGIVSAHRFKQERTIVRELVKHMAARKGENVYQVASFSTPILSGEGMESRLGKPTSKTNSGAEWQMHSFKDLSTTLVPLLKTCLELPICGVSKPLKTKSEKYVRVIATLLPPMEIIVSTDVMAMDMLFVNLMYALIDEDGEIHPPKDTDRREMKLSSSLVSELRQQAAADLKEMESFGWPLSPAFLRQIGMEEKAQEVEQAGAEAEAAQQQQVQQRVVRQAGKRKYEVAEILEERPCSGKAKVWYKVRWQGYHPSWEAWRIEGQPGDPVITWEPEKNVIDSEAMWAWKGWQQQ